MSGIPSEIDSGRTVRRPTRSAEPSMATLARDGVESVATTEATNDELPAAIDGPFVPREIPGGTVIEAQAFERTDDGHALRFDGTTPTHVVGLCSKKKVRGALGEDYSYAEIERAFANGKRMEAGHIENANEAIAAAEGVDR